MYSRYYLYALYSGYYLYAMYFRYSLYVMYSGTVYMLCTLGTIYMLCILGTISLSGQNSNNTLYIFLVPLHFLRFSPSRSSTKDHHWPSYCPPHYLLFMHLLKFASSFRFEVPLSISPLPQQTTPLPQATCFFLRAS